MTNKKKEVTLVIRVRAPRGMMTTSIIKEVRDRINTGEELIVPFSMWTESRGTLRAQEIITLRKHNDRQAASRD